MLPLPWTSMFSCSWEILRVLSDFTVDQATEGEGGNGTECENFEPTRARRNLDWRWFLEEPSLLWKEPIFDSRSIFTCWVSTCDELAPVRPRKRASFDLDSNKLFSASSSCKYYPNIPSYHGFPHKDSTFLGFSLNKQGPKQVQITFLHQTTHTTLLSRKTSLCLSLFIKERKKTIFFNKLLKFNLTTSCNTRVPTNLGFVIRDIITEAFDFAGTVFDESQQCLFVFLPATDDAVLVVFRWAGMESHFAVAVSDRQKVATVALLWLQNLKERLCY